MSVITSGSKMFNTFLTNILNSYLGEVVEDLDVDNLGVGALNGDVLLIDLKLRPDALVIFKLVQAFSDFLFRVSWSFQ